MQAIGNWFQRLYESTGLNFSVFYDAYDWDRYLGGLKMTLFLSVTTIMPSSTGSCATDPQSTWRGAMSPLAQSSRVR